MAKPLSFDLRSRVLAAVDGGLSCRQAAERFGVSASSAIRWAALRRKVGDARPKTLGGDRLSSRTEAHAGLIHAALAETSDITLPELKEKLAAHGAHVSVAAPGGPLDPGYCYVRDRAGNVVMDRAGNARVRRC